MLRFSCLILAGVCCAAPAYAEIYRTVDAQGRVTFSDSPTKNSERVQLPPLSIVRGMTADEIARANARPDAADNKARPVSYRLNFVSPNANQVFQKPMDSIEIAVSTEPSLAAGDRVVLSMNGQALGDTQSTAVASENLERGAQAIVAKVLALNGKVMGEQSVTVFIQQPTKLNANRPKPKP